MERDILKTWNTRHDVIKAVRNEVPGERKKHYPAISSHAGEIERVLRQEKSRKEEDILFLLFTAAELQTVRLNMLERTGHDLLHETWEKKREIIIDNLRQNYKLLFPEEVSGLRPVEEFIAFRLGEAWKKGDKETTGAKLIGWLSPSRTKVSETFQGSRDSGTESFSEEDADILRKLSKTSPNSS